MKNCIIYFIIIFSFLYGRNFIYDEDSWHSILAPEEITSITYNRDKVFFSSTNGLFIYNKWYNDFFYADYILNGIDNKNILIVHYDKYRDKIWILNYDNLLYKTEGSNVWITVNFSSIGIANSRRVINIGSSPDYIILQTRYDHYIFLDPFTGNLIDNIEYKKTRNELLNVKWSSTSKSLLNNNIDLSKYYIFDGWYIESPNMLTKNSKRLYVTCTLHHSNEKKWIGTHTGELFFADEYSYELEKFEAIPPITNINVAYLDDKNEWWIADNNWLYSSLDVLYNQEVIFLSHWNEENNIWTKLFQKRYPQILSKDINTLFRVDDILYVGTSMGLLIYFINLDKWEHIDRSDGLSHNNINDIVYYNDVLYIATSQGLTRLSKIINKTINSIDLLRNKNIYDICFVDGLLYMVTDIGLFYLDIESENVRQITNRKFKNIEENDGRIILSNKNTLFMLNSDFSIDIINKYDKIESFDLCANYVWVNSLNEASIYNFDSNFELTYNTSDGIVGDLIDDLGCIDPWVWFSTNKGLSLYNWRRFHHEK